MKEKLKSLIYSANFVAQKNINQITVFKIKLNQKINPFLINILIKPKEYLTIVELSK
jgi:hypothetical protein